MYDFDVAIDRRESGSRKWCDNQTKFGYSDITPMWVADMDFTVPHSVAAAIQERASHPIYGYTYLSESFFDNFIKWVSVRYGWELTRQDMYFSPGIVAAIGTAVRAYTQPGDKVIIQQPVYYPFADMIRNNKRIIVDSPLIENDGRYTIDYQDLDRKMRDPDVKLFIFCNPHNPVGRVYTAEELKKVGEIAERNNTIVFSDEIHSDLTMPGHRHTPFSMANPAFENLITAMAPSKGFNLAGVQASAVVIRNARLAKAFHTEATACKLGGINDFGAVAFPAAYKAALEDTYLEDLVAYIWNNYQLLCDRMKRTMPKIKVSPLEGTYLAWLDCRALGLSTEELDAFFLRKAHIGCDSGHWFGACGAGFMRLNLGCTKATLNTALDALANAYGRL